jgi:hypothetical protein
MAAARAWASRSWWDRIGAVSPPPPSFDEIRAILAETAQVRRLQGRTRVDHENELTRLERLRLAHEDLAAARAESAAALERQQATHAKTLEAHDILLRTHAEFLVIHDDAMAKHEAAMAKHEAAAAKFDVDMAALKESLAEDREHLQILTRIVDDIVRGKKL